MRCARGLALVCLAVTACGVAACGDPPEKEMQQAQGAIDAARAAGADQYAHVEFVAAQEALQRARSAVAERDYRLALNHALDSRDRARTAAKEAADHKATARGDADRAITEATAALREAEQRLKAAATTKVPPRLLVGLRQAIANVDEAVQKARTAVGQGDYLVIPDSLTGPTARLHGALRDLEAATAAPARRRR